MDAVAGAQEVAEEVYSCNSKKGTARMINSGSARINCPVLTLPAVD